jgi:hypothetical protein
MAENLWQITYCHEHMLIVWERWTGGNLAARKLVENRVGDPLSRGSLFRQLSAAVRALGPREESGGIKAAQAAAAACCQACIDTPTEYFERACRQAMVADLRARRVQANEAMTYKASRMREQVNHGLHILPLPTDTSRGNPTVSQNRKGHPYAR